MFYDSHLSLLKMYSLHTRLYNYPPNGVRDLSGSVWDYFRETQRKEQCVFVAIIPSHQLSKTYCRHKRSDVYNITKRFKIADDFVLCTRSIRHFVFEK